MKRRTFLKMGLGAMAAASLPALSTSGATSARAPMDLRGGSPRLVLPLSGSGWQFSGAAGDVELPDIGGPDYASATWVDISVPHDFQTRYDMAMEQGWYRRQLVITPELAKKRLYLVFEGVATIADVFVNGKQLGQHRGAYTRFIFDISDSVHVGGDNVVAVKVDNRLASKTDCLPNANILYEVWGGIYRPVWLLAVNDLQINPTYYASPGVFITPTQVSSTSAEVGVKVLLRNTSTANQTAVVRAIVLAPDGNAVETLTGPAEVAANQATSIDLSGRVANPLLWEPGSPNLYHVRVELSSGGAILDSVTQPLGFRSVEWDFTSATLKLNGRPYILYGCDLHQETEYKQSAVEPEDLIPNFDTLQDLGANWVRLSHYPRAAFEYDLCDRRGIFCWSENGHSEKDIATSTTDQITTEMVEQNYNHPSILVWSVGNEGSSEPAERAVPIVRALDPTRAVMVANMNCANADYHTANTYPGWYGNDRWAFEFNRFVTETGAGGVVTTHVDYGMESRKVNSYEPEEYQQLVAEAIFQKVFRFNTGGVGMFTWWILRDFNDHKYKDATAPYHNGINTKGLETYGGFRKDVYYLYRCFLRPATPTVHIASKLYFLRRGALDNGIKVYSNAKAVTLSLNGKVVSTVKNGSYSQNDPLSSAGSQTVDNVFFWPVSLHQGKNSVSVTDGQGTSDSATIYFYGANGLPELPAQLLPITDLVSTNPNNQAYYMDMPLQAQWPVYYDFDSTADNTLDTIPEQVAGATWLALRRVTKTGQDTLVNFIAAKPLTVFVICTHTQSSPGFLAGTSFHEVATVAFRWRDDNLMLTEARLYAMHVTAGEQVRLQFGDTDALVSFGP